MLQFVGGSGPRLPKYNVLIGKPVSCPVALYSPLIATSPDRHDAVELAKFTNEKSGGVGRGVALSPIT